MAVHKPNTMYLNLVLQLGHDGAELVDGRRVLSVHVELDALHQGDAHAGGHVLVPSRSIIVKSVFQLRH